MIKNIIQLLLNEQKDFYNNLQNKPELMNYFLSIDYEITIKSKLLHLVNEYKATGEVFFKLENELLLVNLIKDHFNDIKENSLDKQIKLFINKKELIKQRSIDIDRMINFVVEKYEEKNKDVYFYIIFKEIIPSYLTKIVTQSTSNVIKTQLKESKSNYIKLLLLFNK
jgi:hypothetical protein